MFSICQNMVVSSSACNWVSHAQLAHTWKMHDNVKVNVSQLILFDWVCVCINKQYVYSCVCTIAHIFTLSCTFCVCSTCLQLCQCSWILSVDQFEQWTVGRDAVQRWMVCDRFLPLCLQSNGIASAVLTTGNRWVDWWTDRLSIHLSI